MANRQAKVNIGIGFSVDRSGINTLQSDLQQIGNSIKTMKPDAMTEGLKQASQTAQKLDGILDKTFNSNLGTLNVTKFNQELAKSGMTLKTIKTDLTSFGNQGVTAYNKLAQSILGTNVQLKESNKLLDSMATTMMNTVKWGITSSIFNTITGSIQKAYGYVKQLDTSLNDIRIVTNKSADEMDKFADKANKAAKALGASTLDYTNASLIYYQQGLSDEEVAARAETTVKVANVTGQAGNAVSEQLTAVWNGYKVSAEETEQYIDKLAAVAATTAADLEELSVGMSKVASAANAMGVNFDDLNAQIATIVSVTRQAPESVGTALKTIYARLGDLKVDGVDEFGVKLGEVSSQLQTMGIQILDANGDMRDMTSVMTEVAEKWDTWTRAQQQAAAVAMAGKRQYNNLVALFENWDMYSDALEISKDSLGTLQKQQDIYMESTAAKLKELKATWQGLYKDLIKSDDINNGIDLLTELVDKIDEVIKGFGGGIKAVTAFGTILFNVFNKQISQALIQGLDNFNKYKNNLELVKLKLEQIKAGEGHLIGRRKFANEVAEEANTRAQINVASQLYDVRGGLTQEQGAQGIQLQQEIGSLEGQIEKLKFQTDQIKINFQNWQGNLKNANKEAQDIVNSLQNNQDILKLSVHDLDILTDATDKILDDEKEIYSVVKEEYETRKLSLKSAKDQQTIEEEIAKLGIPITKNIKNKLAAEDDIILKRKIGRDILDEELLKIKENSEEIEKEKNNLQTIIKYREQEIDFTTQLKYKQAELNYLLEQARKNIDISGIIRAFSGVAASASMLIGSINTLKNAWDSNSESSFVDRMTQSLMSLGMILPGIIKMAESLPEVFSKISKASFGLFSIIGDGVKNYKNLSIALGTYNSLQQLNSVILPVVTALQKKKNRTDKEEILLTQLTSKNIFEKIGALKGLNQTQLEHIGVTEADTAAVLSFNVALEGTMAIAGGVAVVIGAVVLAFMGLIYLETKATEKQLEKIRNDRAETKAISNKIKVQNEELNQNKELINSYLEVYSQYEKNITSKEDLSKASEKLINFVSKEQIAIANLTGDYKKLADEAKRARLEQERQQVVSYHTGIKENVDKFLNKDFEANLDLDSSTPAFSSESTRDEFVSSFEFFNMGDNKVTLNKEAFNDFDDEKRKAFQLEIKKILNPEDGVFYSDKDRNTFVNVVKEELDRVDYSDFFHNVGADTQNLAKTQLQLDIDSLVDFEDNKNANDFEKDYYQAKELVEKSGIYSEDQIAEATLDLIQKISSSNNEYIDQIHGINFLIDKYKEEHPEAEEIQIKNFEEKLKNLTKEDLVYLLNLDVSLDEESLDEALNQIKAKTAVEQNELGIDLAEGFRENLAKDQSKMSKKDKEQLKEERQAFSDQYNLDDAWWEKFDASKPIDQMSILNELIEKQNKELIKNQDTLNENQDGLEEKQKNLIETSENLQNQLKNTPAGPAFEELSKAVEKTNKDLEVTSALIDELDVDIPIEDQLIELFDNRADGIISIAEKAKSAAELIGEGFTVAAEDAQELLDQYPELYNAAEVLANGDIKLNQEVVKTVLGGNEEVIKSNTAVTEKRLEEEIAVLQAQINFNQAKMKILDQYLKGEITNQEKENKINKAGAQFEEDLIAAVGQDQYDAAIQAAKNNEELTDATLKNFATMIDGADQLSQAIQQALKGEAVTASVNGLSGTGGSFSDYQNYASVASTKTVLDDAAAAAEAERQMKALKEETASYEQALAETQFTLSKLRSGTSASVEAMENVMAGKAGKKDKSSSKSKEEKEKQIDEEFDRYWEYKKAIDMLDKSMARLQKTQSKLHGKELIDSLKKENELLEKQKANYDALIHAQEREAGELQGHLMYYGAAFNANGELANYADVTSSMLDKLTSGEVSEKSYEDFKKALERYDTLYYSEIQDTLDKLDDARRKQLENNLKGWETEIQIKLDLTEAERNWNDFVRDLEQDFRKIYEDLTIESAFDTKNFETYNDDLNTTLQAINDVENEITKLASTGRSDMFESMSEAQEKLKDLGNELIENGKSLYELYESVWDNYINKLDQAADNLNDINDEFGHITNELEYEKKLIELIYGDKAYDKMTKYYDAQQKNINMQIDSLKTQRDFWEDQFQAAYMMNKEEHNVILNDMSTWTEDMRKAYDQMIESQESLNDKITEGIENLTDNYLNKLAETFDKLENAVWNMNLDALSDDWDRITGLADEYLDDVEGAYEIQNLANQIDKDINNTSDIKAAQRLQAFREKEIAILREKDNLTQDDVDLAEARYQIMLKEIALEDARNAKNNMKLTRNTSGNWTYQYVADDEDVADKRQDLLQGYQDLYKMADDAYQHSMELLMNTWQEMQEKMQEAAELYKNDSEKLAEEQLKIRESYAPMMEAAAKNSELYRQEAVTASSAVFSETCDQDAETYQYLTDLQKELVDGVKDKHLEDYEAIRSAVIDGVYPEIAVAAQSAFLETNLNSSTAAADIIHQWANDDGESVKAKLNEAIDSIEDNVKEFEDELDNMKEVAGTDFENVDEYINTTIGKIGEMEEKTKKMTDKSEQEIDELRWYVEQLGVAFGGILDNIYDATEAMASYKDAVGLVNEELRGLIITAQEWTGLGFDPSAAGLGGGSTKTDDNPVEKKYKIVSDPNGAAGTIGIQYLTGNNKGQYRAITKDVTNFTNVSNEQQATAEKRSIVAELKKRGIDLGVTLDEIDFSNFTQFASGGYTGDWSSDHGALAILHNKELVLNEDDTSNFLKATSLLRDISKINGSIEDSIMTSILSMMNALNPRIGGFNTNATAEESSGNIFNITAEFPNANDVTSIREAILSLPNIASQYVHQR